MQYYLSIKTTNGTRFEPVIVSRYIGMKAQVIFLRDNPRYLADESVCVPESYLAPFRDGEYVGIDGQPIAAGWLPNRNIRYIHYFTTDGEVVRMRTTGTEDTVQDLVKKVKQWLSKDPCNHFEIAQTFGLRNTVIRKIDSIDQDYQAETATV